MRQSKKKKQKKYLTHDQLKDIYKLGYKLVYKPDELTDEEIKLLKFTKEVKIKMEEDNQQEEK